MLCDGVPFLSVIAQASSLLSEAQFTSEPPETLDPLFKFHETIAKVSQHMHPSVPTFWPLTLISSSLWMAIEPTNIRVLSNSDALTADGEVCHSGDAVGALTGLDPPTGRLLDQRWSSGAPQTLPVAFFCCVQTHNQAPAEHAALALLNIMIIKCYGR